MTDDRSPTMPPSDPAERRVPVRWLLFFLLISVGIAGWRPLWDPDEGRYAETAREMLVAGEWLIPTLEGEPHLTKPPLTYWLSMIGYHIFGVNAWGARFFVSVAFFATILAVIELARTWGWSRDQALCSGLVFSTSALPFVCGHILTTDMILTCFETLGVLCIWKVWKQPTRAGLWSLAFWAAFGFAFLTKGPPGWLPLLAVIGARWVGARPEPGGRLQWIPGVFLLAAIAFTWFVVVVLADPERARYFVVEEFYNRIFTDEHERENEWWRYPLVVAGGLFPWVFLWPNLLRPTWNQLRGGWSTLSAIKRFSVLWFALPFTIFLLAKSRMTLYMVPLFVPIAIWAGRTLHDAWLSDFFQTGRLPRWARLTFGGYIALLVIVLSIPYPIPGSETEKLLAREVRRELGDRHETTRYFMLEGSVYHTASFYLESSVRELNKDPEKLAEFDREIRNEGGHAVFLIKDSRFEKIEKKDVPVRILARSDQAIAFEIDTSQTVGEAGQEEEAVEPDGTRSEGAEPQGSTEKE